MLNYDSDSLLNIRLKKSKNSFLDIDTTLHNFALINYSLPIERLLKIVPQDKFDIQEFNINGKLMAMLSVVPFYDYNFHFKNFFPFFKFCFGQTNYRVYVIDKVTKEPCVWFFGTTLASYLVFIAKFLWKIPWYYASYKINCEYDFSLNKYKNFYYKIKSDWCSADIEIEDTGEPIRLEEGFISLKDQELILTHPVKGYYYRSNGVMGTYSVWHEKIVSTIGKPINLYFSMFEKLGILTQQEMQNPHSIFICPQTKFEVLLPPKIA